MFQSPASRHQGLWEPDRWCVQERATPEETHQISAWQLGRGLFHRKTIGNPEENGGLASGNVT